MMQRARRIVQTFLGQDNNYFEEEEDRDNEFSWKSLSKDIETIQNEFGDIENLEAEEKLEYFMTIKELVDFYIEENVKDEDDVEEEETKEEE